MLTKELTQQIEQFRERTAQFAAGELSVKDYKGFSGKFGSYAQRGAGAGMLRLRIAGGQLSKEKLKSVIDICKKYDIRRIHCTTCQTIQLHDIPFDRLADVMTDAIECGFYTLGGGGDFPRNVMVSPLTGVEKDENFDVFPYAEKAAEYLISRIDKVKMPRKLKVGFSNSPSNSVHATFRDLGFVSRPDGRFDVYCAGGMGLFPKMGVKVAQGVGGGKTLYYIRAMIDFFCEYGNYENRSKARTRYIQDVLGADFEKRFDEKLQASLSEGGLDIDVSPAAVEKKGKKADFSSRYVSEQKQEGLYTVKYHPIGGSPSLETVEQLYETVKDMDSVSLRLSPDETIYIINCNGDEARKVLDTTADGARSDIEESVACIGASVCQQGLRDSQSLLRDILGKVGPLGFAADALPVLHISGCMSSCGTHQIGSIGFHGKVKMVDKKPVAGFTVSVRGCDRQGAERFGDDLGVIASDDIPEFIAELGRAVTAAGMSWTEFSKAHADRIDEIAKKYI